MHAVAWSRWPAQWRRAPSHWPPASTPDHKLPGVADRQEGRPAPAYPAASQQAAYFSVNCHCSCWFNQARHASAWMARKMGVPSGAAATLNGPMVAVDTRLDAGVNGPRLPAL